VNVNNSFHNNINNYNQVTQLIRWSPVCLYDKCREVCTICVFACVWSGLYVC